MKRYDLEVAVINLKAQYDVINSVWVFQTPNGWQEATTEEMEALGRAIQEEAAS